MTINFTNALKNRSDQLDLFLTDEMFPIHTRVAVSLDVLPQYPADGDRLGTVESKGGKYLHVRCDIDGKIRNVSPEDADLPELWDVAS